MIKPILSIALMVLGLLLYACQVPSKEGKAVPKPKKPWEKGNSIAYNQEINEREQLKIAAFLDHRKDFKMSLTPSGLRYPRRGATPPLAACADAVRDHRGLRRARLPVRRHPGSTRAGRACPCPARALRP